MRAWPRSATRTNHRGVTLIVAMIMLILISLVVIGAFSLSSADLKSIFNFQSRSAAIAAANQAIERVVSSHFYSSPAAESIGVDMDGDGNVDFTVTIAKPRCIKAIEASKRGPNDLDSPFPLPSSGTWFTDWDLDATVKDDVSGASVQVRQGVRILISDAEKTLSCDTPQSPF